MSSIPTGTVTFLFTDIEGSTRLWQEKPQAMSVSHARHDAILRDAIQSNHGYTFQIAGDSFKAAFHNALDGLCAVLTAQRGLQAEAWGETGALRVRMGLHTGAAEQSPDGSNTYSEGYTTLASTQRVMSAAHGGQVLLSQTAHDLLQNDLPAGVSLRDLGEHRLKDLRSLVHLYQLVASDLVQDFPPINSLDTLPNNLPLQLTSFIGRLSEMHEASQLLSSTRLLTLIGPGGTGKTRLSLQVAEEQLPRFKDGVWLVELAPLSDPVLVVPAIASVFELREVQDLPLINILTDYLRARQLLLILDNCEHLVDASAQIANQLLHACPQLKLIASSREALGVEGESVYRVPSLTDDEALRLFVERAEKAEPHFKLTDHNASPIAQICRRLDGIPLAIELAAARVRVFTPEQIAERLDDRFKLLTGGTRTALPRQQTLRALIDWSYQTLNETEQSALRWFAVFSGGWTYEAAEFLVGEAIAIDSLLGLVNKSLVIVDQRDGQARYRTLETIRQYAMEKLFESGEASQARTRHLDYMLQITGSAGLDAFGEERLESLNLMEVEHDNLRLALEWAAGNDVRKAVGLALNVGGFWTARDYNREAVDWCRTLLERSEALPDLDAQRARLYALLGWVSITIGNHKDGRTAVESAIALAKKVNDVRTVVRAECTLALACVFLGDFPTAQQAIMEGEQIGREKDLKGELALILATRAQIAYITTQEIHLARAFLDESTSLGRKSGNAWATTFFSAFGLARLAALLGDLDSSRAKFLESIEMAQKVGNKRLIYAGQSEYAHILRENGQIDEALVIYRDLVPKWKDIGHRQAVSHELECIAYILARKGAPERAAAILGAVEAFRKQIDSSLTKPEEVEYMKEVSALGGILGEDELRKRWDEGGRLSIEQAIELALSQEQAST